mmetsp:Transcript_15937/g.46096  ORF Transcript_15937/g.46096 Transcript_15937/m.46096 type:complete len:685 (-) Transcript_15937:311-2365(-)
MVGVAFWALWPLLARAAPGVGSRGGGVARIASGLLAPEEQRAHGLWSAHPRSLLRSERPISRSSRVLGVASTASGSFVEVRSSRGRAHPGALEQSQDCAYGQWGPWTRCSQSCGGGSHTRKREVLREARGSGLQCTEGDQEDGPCNEQGCPVDCVWHPWQTWLGCSATCGGGLQRRTREPEREAENAGTPCFPESAWEQRPCEAQPCPIDCEWTPWSTWSDCSRECGGGRQLKTRQVQTPSRHGGSLCTGDAEEERECNAQLCDLDCKWGPWGSYSECNATCGGGWHEAHRSPDVQQSGSGSPCVGESVDRRQCNTQPCPEDCLWADWADWGACSASCGGGSASRQRSIEVHANADGRQCEGSNTESRDCHPEPCPIDCHWEDWQPWTHCSVSCRQGERHRSRNKVREAHNGRPCSGPMVVTEVCTEDTHCLSEATNAPGTLVLPTGPPDHDIFGELRLRVSRARSVVGAERGAFERAVGDALWQVASDLAISMPSAQPRVEVTAESAEEHPQVGFLASSPVYADALPQRLDGPLADSSGVEGGGIASTSLAFVAPAASEVVARYRIAAPPVDALGRLLMAPYTRLEAEANRQLHLHKVLATVQVLSHIAREQGQFLGSPHSSLLPTWTTSGPTWMTASSTSTSNAASTAQVRVLSRATSTTSATTSVVKETLLQEVEDMIFGR